MPNTTGSAFEIIHQMHDDMSRARLPRVLKILAGQHVAIESETKFHWFFLGCDYLEVG